MKARIEKTFILSLIFTLFNCTQKEVEIEVEKNIAPQTQLIQQSVDATLWYAKSAEREYIFLQTYQLAQRKLNEKLAESYKKPLAVVLDLDETVIDNSPYFFKLIQEGKTYQPDSWAEYEKSMTSKLLPGSKAFIDFCLSNNVKVFFISNRSEENKDFTYTNLVELGISGVGKEHLLFKTTTSNKDERREQVANNNEILLFLGDNLRDLSEGYAKRNADLGIPLVHEQFNTDSDRLVLFPNPVYGEWEKPIVNNERADSLKLFLKEEYISTL